MKKNMGGFSGDQDSCTIYHLAGRKWDYFVEWYREKGIRGPGAAWQHLLLVVHSKRVRRRGGFRTGSLIS